MTRHALLLLLIIRIAGCSSARPGSVDCGPLGSGIRLTNGTVELVIVPSVGRIMRYGYVGGENVLFVDPANRHKAPSGQFISFGGDKLWIWPQDDWQKYIGRSFPPPASVDGHPWTSRLLSKNAVLLTSEIVEPWGVRLEREIALAEQGSRVTITNRLIKVDARATPPTAAWCVTQIPVADVIWVRGEDAANRIAYQMLMQDPWKSMDQQGRWLHLERDPRVLSKTGIAGDQIVVAVGTSTFTQTLLKLAPSYSPRTDQVQIFSFADPGGDHPNQVPYTELEFTSGRTDGTNRPQSVSMTVVWELDTR